MSNERKQWSVKDNDFVWDSYLAGCSNEAIAESIGRTPIAVGVRISKLKTRYGHDRPTTAAGTPSKVTKPIVVETDKPPTLTGMFFVSLTGAVIGVLLAKFLLNAII